MVRWNPLVAVLYFAAVLAFTILFLHPLFLCLSLLGAAVLTVQIGGRAGVRYLTRFCLPMSLIAGVLNPLFVHRGATVLCYFPWGNPLTLESVLFGISAGMLFGAVMLWCYCMGKTVSADKLQSLLARRAPTMALLCGMTLRFIPRFAEQARRIAMAQRGIGINEANAGKRVKNAVAVFSALVTWAMENGADTLCSLTCRGSELRGKKGFALYPFHPSDGAWIALVAALSASTALGNFLGISRVQYYPLILIKSEWVGWAPYAVLCFLPAILNGAEVIRWRLLQSKI